MASQPGDVQSATSKHESRRERFARYDDIVNAVIRKYIEIKSLSPVVASCIDPETTKQSQRLSFEAIGYATDIERATERALGTDRLDLQAAWFNMALGQPVKPTLRNEVVWRCGRIYSARDLAPWSYWNKRPR